MTRKIPVVICVAIIFGITITSAQNARAQLATISVQTSQPGREIPADFVGFSLEVSQGGQGLQALHGSRGKSLTTNEQGEYALGRPGAPNNGFFQFMRNLGHGVLRLGGNSQDNTCWEPQRAPHPSWCQATLTGGDLKLFSRAAELSGWQLILGLNLKQNSAAWALREITQGIAPNLTPGQLVGVEIGNEPDLFRGGARPETYSPAEHAKEVLSYVQAIHKNPVANRYAMVGPATCCGWRNAHDLRVFIDGVGRKNLRLITVHNYSKTVCGGKSVTIAQLLAPGLMAQFNKTARTWVAAVHSRGLPIALAETNSASCGGMPGVSNAFASTVWGLDYMDSVAQDGFRYINFHMSYRPGGSSYNAIDSFGRQDASGRWHYRNVAEPLYYAMYLFARNASGKHLLPARVRTTANIRAFAVSGCRGCAVKVFVVNKDLQAGGNVRVQAAGRRGAASLLLLRAPSLSSSASAVSYGGVQFDSQGNLPTPHTTEVRPDASGNYTFDLPNASAAMLTIPES